MGCGSSVARTTETQAVTKQAPARPSEATPTPEPPSPAKEGKPPPSRPPSATPTTPRSAVSTPPSTGPPQTPPRPPSRPPLNGEVEQGGAPPPAPPAPQQQEPQSEAQVRARDLTHILSQRLREQREREALEAAEREREAAERQASLQRQGSSLQVASRQPSQASVAQRQPSRLVPMSSRQKRAPSSATGGGGGGGGGGDGGGGGGLGDELAALLALGSSAERFQDLMRDLMVTHTQVLLPGDANPEDAATLQAVSGCTTDQAVRLLDCLAVVRAAADALEPSPPLPDPEQTPDSSPEDPEPGAGKVEHREGEAAAAGAAAAAAASGGPPATSGAAMTPSPQQLTRQLGALAGLVNDVPGLRTAAMARDAASALLRVLRLHPERAAAANAALALAALAAGPPPHKASLIAAGAVDGLLQAARGRTAAAEANGGDAPAVAANSCSALGNLATGHPAGAAAVAAGGGAAAAGGGGATSGIDTLLSLLAVDNPPNIRTNAAGVILQLTGAHESYRAAVAAGGGVAALAAGMLRGPDAPACNAATVLYNLAALSPPSLRPAMAQAGGQFAVVPQLLLCVCGRNAAGAPDESVASASAARINASAVLLELCKDPRSAPALAEPTLAVPAALAALAAGRLPPPPPATAGGSASAAPADDPLAGGVALLYPVPPVVRGNCLLGLMALARMGPDMQLELGRCGALGALLELLGPGQDPAMQVNSANALCSLAAANADIHSALVAARCVPLLAGLIAGGGDAARANVAAVFVTMMRDGDARQQLQECGALTSLVRLAAALLDERMAATAVNSSGGGGGGVSGGGASSDPGGVLCNTVGALAEAAKHPDLRRALMQVEFGESLSTLLRCVKEAPEPAQVNAAAALCHLCREKSAAVQLGRLGGVELLKEAVGAHPEEGGSGSWTRPSSRLRHNASRALARLQEQLSAAEEEDQAAAAARAVGRATAAAGSGGVKAAPSAAPSGSIHAEALGDDDATAAGGGGGSGRLEPPRAGWDLQAEASAAGARGAGMAAPAASASRVFDEVMSYGGDGEESDVDDLSTVITPPLPLAAF